MALLEAKGISKVALELLVRSISLPRTVSAVPGAEFAGSNGDTITVRVPQPGSARTQSNPGDSIQYDDIDEVPVDVKLGHLYHAKLVTDEEMSWTIEDFARQITVVQVDAVAIAAEDALCKAMNDLSADDSFAATPDEDDTKEMLLTAREFLGKNNAPSNDRYLAVSPQIATRLLLVPEFTKANESGSTDALRNATIGRIYGFEVVESNGLDDGTALAYHRSGFCFANRVPVNPRGATDSAATSQGGIGLRQLFQYDPLHLSDASVVSTFAGASAVFEDGSSASDNQRFYKLDTASS